MRRIVRVLAIVVAVQLVTFVAGQVARLVMRRRTPGAADPLADEFDLVNVMEGTEFASRAIALRAASIQNIMGGVELDLTEAQLARGGAYVQVTTIMGGTEITVPRGWRVALLGQAMMGAHDLDVTPEDDLAFDAPILTVEGRTVLGAVGVRAVPARVPA
ncbi:MAG: cell wall-active antibiotics response protein [Dehalococcoidia bacterium]|nr:cell wall-active antibiotics response protein [Dehalococcoidia bacterium]